MDGSICIGDSLVNSNDESSKERTVLETFSHQVGGRSLILTYDRNTVCKPLNLQELSFYLDLPESLRPFTPLYKGVVKVHVQFDNIGKLILTSSQSPTRSNGNIEFEHDIHEDEDNEQDSKQLDGTEESLNSEGSVNPWTFHCQSRHYESLKESVNNNKPVEFMLLEDLVYNYTSPCIMDLKMGNTMHASYTDKEKYARQKAKVNASTSKTLGLRIAGIQTYNQESKKYVYQNKYFGFELDDQSFKQELYKFVHSGTHLRKDVVMCFLEKLKELSRCLEGQDKLRFFSSSLLLIYEGQQKDCSSNMNGDCTSSMVSAYNESNGERTFSQNGFQKADVKMIDFARSFHYKKNATVPVGVDESYLLGLRNLIKMFQEILLEDEGTN